jgi:hypothetical protein
VIHDRHVKVCRSCIQPGHVVRNCQDFFYDGDAEYKGIMRECVAKVGRPCNVCGERGFHCTCTRPTDGDDMEHQEVVVEESVMEERTGGRKRRPGW